MALTDAAVLDLLLTARYVGGPAFRQMESDIAGLVDSTSGLERAGAALNALGNMAIVAGTGIAIGLGYAAEKAAVYDQSLQRIKATAGLSDPQLKNLSSTAMDLSDKWGISAQSIVDGSYFLVSGIQALGYNYQDVVNNQILPAFAAYVEASGAGKQGAVDFQTAAQDLPHVLAGMHVPIQQWADALGQLTVVESQSGLSQQQLLASMTRFAPTAGFLGMDFGQSAALAGALSTLGVSGSGTGGARVGTEEAAALRNMFTTAKGSSTLMQLMGTSDPSALNQFFDKKTGQLSNVDPLLTLLYASLNSPGMTGDPTKRLATANSLFGATGMRAMAELMTPGSKGMPSGIQTYQNELNAMKTPGMAYDKMLTIAQGQAQGPQAQWEIFKQRLENLAITIGNQVIPALLSFAGWIGTAATELRKFISAHPNIVADAMKAVPALIGGGIGLKGAGGVLSFLGHDMTASGKSKQKAIDALAKTRGFPGLADREELLASGWKPGILDRFGFAAGDLFKNSSALSGKGGGLLGRLFGGINALGGAEVAGKTYAPGAATGGFAKQFLEKHFPQAALAGSGLNVDETFAKHFPGKAGMGKFAYTHAEKLDLLTRGPLRGAGGRFMPTLGKDAFAATPLQKAGALGKDIGGGIKDLASGGLSKVVDLFKNLGGAVGKAALAFPGLVAGIAPFLVIALVIAGIIAIIVLSFLSFRKEAEAAGKTIGTGLNPIFKLFGTIFQGAIKQIEGAWNKAWPAISTAMKEFFKELPKVLPLLQLIGGVLGAVFAVIAGVVVGIANGFIKALPFIIGFVSKVISLFGDIAKFLIDVVKAIFGKGGWGAVGDDLKAIVSDIWGVITNGFGMIAHFIGGFIQGILDFFHMLWDKLVGHSIIPDMINGIIDWFKKLPGQVITFIAQMITNITNSIKGFATNILSTAATIGTNIITGIGNGINTMKSWLGTQLGNVIHGAVNLIPGGAALAKTLHIPGFAMGTMNAPGGWAMVGENGPELMNVPGGSRIYPNGQGPAQGPQSSGSTFWESRMIQSIRESRYGPTQPVTAAGLLRQLDPQYRYSYQYTA